jgi:hypothetical protein
MTDRQGGQFKPFFRHLKRYFRAYGGWSGIFGSPLFLGAVLIAALNYRQWLVSGWTDKVYALLPNLLGFSLGTYAIIFSLLTNRIKLAMRILKNNNSVSYLEQVNSTFFHFIFVQVITLIWSIIFDGSILRDIAIIFKGKVPIVWSAFLFSAKIGSFVGYLLMIYSIFLVIGAALAIYRLALIVDPAES